MGRTKGFTLIELLAVIAIAVILMGLTVPIAKSMIESNRVMMCSANLQRIAQALKMYYMDYQGVPPVWISENGSNPTTPYDEMVDPAAGPMDNAFMILWREGYLKNRNSLHCPRDKVHIDPSDPAYYQSYVERQPDSTPAEEQVKIEYQNDQDSGDAWNGTDISINRYKYMPCRIFRVPALGGADPHTWAEPPSAYQAQRMLSPGMRAVTVGSQQYWVPVVSSTWIASDNTIVTWCDYHADHYTVEGVGQYHVLFWDGTVSLKPRTLFEQGEDGDPPPAAWEVGPGD